MSKRPAVVYATAAAVAQAAPLVPGVLENRVEAFIAAGSVLKRKRVKGRPPRGLVLCPGEGWSALLERCRGRTDESRGGWTVIEVAPLGAGDEGGNDEHGGD